MAGIGFSLRAISGSRGFLGRAQGLGAAGIVTSGPWLLASLAWLVVGRGSWNQAGAEPALEQFRVCVTWLLAASLVWTSPLQLMLTRFVADRAYLRERERILPNLLGAFACSSASSALLAVALSRSFAHECLVRRVLLGTAFVAACDAWLVVIMLASLRQHRAVLACFASAYAVGVGASLVGARLGLGLDGLIAGFALAQAFLVFLGLAVLARCLPPPRSGGAVELAFLRRGAMFLDLGLTGLAFNLGCWADELVSWFDPAISRSVLGPLRASSVYDVPSFAAGLWLVPGTAVFLVHVETELADRQRAFFDAVLSGATLHRLEELAALFIDAARRGLAALLRTQAAAWLACIAFGSHYLRWLTGAPSSELHLPLFHLTALAAALQVLVSATLSMLFYLDRRGAALALSLLLCTSNAAFSWLTQRAGAAFCGYGHALAMGLTCLVGLSLLNRAFANLIRNTFMLQPAGT